MKPIGRAMATAAREAMRLVLMASVIRESSKTGAEVVERELAHLDVAAPEARQPDDDQREHRQDASP